jgi:hypothetical protein
MTEQREKYVAGPPETLPVGPQGSPPRRQVRIAPPRVEVDDDEMPDLPPHVEWNSVVLDHLDYPINLAPSNPDFPAYEHFWARRPLDAITGATLHHTGGGWTWQQVANYHTAPYKPGYGKGYPTIQYHYWVEPGKVLEVGYPEWALWHDHTGRKPTTLAAVMRGDFSKEPPTDEHIETAAWLFRWLMLRFGFGLDGVHGHDEQAALAGVTTTCPGWGAMGWRGQFFEVLEDIL